MSMSSGQSFLNHAVRAATGTAPTLALAGVTATWLFHQRSPTLDTVPQSRLAPQGPLEV